MKIEKFYNFIRHEDEYEADKIAIKIIESAGMDPVSGGNLLPKLDHLDVDSDTHPATSKRVQRVTEFSKEAEPKTGKPLSNNFKKSIGNAVEMIRRKRILIKISSYAAGTVSTALLGLIYYFAFSFDYTGNAVGNFAFEFCQGALVRIAPYAFLILVPGTFYLIYDKMYHWLKKENQTFTT